jgi:hypothetical protein
VVKELVIPFVDLARGFRQTPDGQYTPISSDFVGAMEKIKTGAFITSKVGYRKSRQAEEVMDGQVRFHPKPQTPNSKIGRRGSRQAGKSDGWACEI